MTNRKLLISTISACALAMILALSASAEVLPTVDSFNAVPILVPSASSIGEFGFGGDGTDAAPIDDGGRTNFYLSNSGPDLPECGSAIANCGEGSTAFANMTPTYSLSSDAVTALGLGLEAAPASPNAQVTDSASLAPGGLFGFSNLYLVPIALAALGLMGLLIAGISQLMRTDM
jgi:hypothetical protein